MKPHEIVILFLTIAALLAGLIWLFWNNLRRRWPKGTRVDVALPATADTSRMELYLFYAPEIASNAIDKRFGSAAIAAVWSCAVAWAMARKDKRVTKDESPARETIVYVETAEVMAAKAKAWGYKSIAGYIAKFQTAKWGGDELPMIVVSELNLAEIISTGEPVIHEMLHALERDYVAGKDDHSNPVVWAAAAHRESASQPSIQEVARQTFLGRGQSLITTT